jgi:predicted metal-dependent peptidase
MSALEDKLRELGIGGGWNHPFFLPALSRLNIKEDAKTPTMSVQMNGKVRVNPEWAKTLPDQELTGVLFHEIMHLMMNHAWRQENRTAMVTVPGMGTVSLFNIAADMAINQVLKEMGVKLPQGALYPPSGDEDLNTEQLYEKLAEQAQQNSGGGGQGQKVLLLGRARGGGETGPQPAAGCGVEPSDEPGGGTGSGEQEKGQGEAAGASGEPATAQEWEQEWEKVAVQARNIAAGTEAGKSLAKLFERRQAMRWKQLLKSTVARAVAQHGRDEQTMTRRNRRSPARIIFPGWKSTKVQVACIVDSSGSVSDEMLSKIVDEIVEIAHVGDARIYLVTHDAVVQFSGWVDGMDRGRVAQRTHIGRGGTRFSVAYEELDRIGKKFDACIHLTDGYPCETWPHPPRAGRRFIVALVADCSGGWPDGTTIVKVKV